MRKSTSKKIFIDIAFGKTNNEKAFVELVKSKGILYDEPLDSKECGIEMDSMITESSFFLFVLGTNDAIRMSNVKLAKNSNIPYRYILLENESSLLSVVPEDELDLICHYYKEEEKDRLFEELKPFERSVYIINTTPDLELGNTLSMQLKKRGYLVYSDRDVLVSDIIYPEAIKQAIRECNYYIVILPHDKLKKNSYWEKEVQIAIETKKYISNKMIIPISSDLKASIGIINSMESSILEELLKYHCLEFSFSDYSSFIESLKSAIQGEQSIKNKSIENTEGEIKDNESSIENSNNNDKLYDVFISCKNEDYKLAQPLHDFLVDNGLKVFFADSEIKKRAESQYADVIDEALDQTKHLIVFATKIEYIKSKWVKYEWSTFSNDLKSNYRDGNLITIRSSEISPKSLPASLRHLQSFRIENFKDVLPFVKK